jgi:hypothetical protein
VREDVEVLLHRRVEQGPGGEVRLEHHALDHVPRRVDRDVRRVDLRIRGQHLLRAAGQRALHHPGGRCAGAGDIEHAPSVGGEVEQLHGVVRATPGQGSPRPLGRVANEELLAAVGPGADPGLHHQIIGGCPCRHRARIPGVERHRSASEVDSVDVHPCAVLQVQRHQDLGWPARAVGDELRVHPVERGQVADLPRLDVDAAPRQSSFPFTS